MRSEMFFPKKFGNNIIISKDKPIDYDHSKKVILNRNIENYEEVYEYLKEQNITSSGNSTILTKEELEHYKNLNLFSVLMRKQSEIKEEQKLIGTILSVAFPVKCNVEAGEIDGFEYTKEFIITHGCTTFLNVHKTIRGFKMCMILIRELAKYGYENQIYCSYQLSSFKMCDTALEIKSWYRPINIMNSLLLGFTFPGFNELSNFNKNRMLYKCKLPKDCIVDQVKEKNLKKAFDFYQNNIKDKKFVFYPDIELFRKWTKEYGTYIVKNDKNIIGIFSIGTINCKMLTGVEGRLCLPLIYISKNIKVMKSLLNVAEEKGYDALYSNEVGDLTENVFKEINAIPNSKVSYFSLYNNNMSLCSADIYVPLF